MHLMAARDPVEQVHFRSGIEYIILGLYICGTVSNGWTTDRHFLQPRVNDQQFEKSVDRATNRWSRDRPPLNSGHRSIAE